MLDISSPASPLTGEYPLQAGPLAGTPAAGARYPGRAALQGTRHHLLLNGPADPIALTRLRRRWAGLVGIGTADASRGAALPPPGGALLIRPDGYIGFRAATADEPGLAAVEAHLASYLIPA